MKNQNWLERYQAIPEYLIRGDRPGVRWDGSFAVVKAEEGSEGRKIYTVRITTEQYDRANDRILAAGIDMTHYRSNPVVLWAHDSGFESTPAIGTSPFQDLIRTPEGLGAVDAGADFHGLTQLSREIAALVEAGVIRTASIGGIPLDFDEAELEEGAYPTPWYRAAVSRTYTKLEMLEFSMCNIPMNPGALVQNSLNRDFESRLRDAVQRGVIAGDGEYMQKLGTGRIVLNQQTEEKDMAGKVSKAGRVLSAVNQGKVKDAHKLLGEVLESAGFGEEEPEGEEPQQDPEEEKSVSARLGRLEAMLAQIVPPAAEQKGMTAEDFQALLRDKVGAQ